MLFVVVALAVLAACGSTTAQNPTAAPAAQPTAPVAATAADASAAPAAAATAELSQAANGARTFQIVPDQTEASYEVQEQFLNRDLPSQAIGKTNAVEGQFQFSADAKPTGQVSKITVDLRTLTSDSSRRDGRIRTSWLESDKYPFAEFTSTEVQNLPDSYSEGQEVSFKLVGNMTIREVTKPVTFDVTGKLQGDTVTGTATTQILMKDFGFDAPNIAGMLTVKDGVTIMVNFTAKEAANT
jgi:polyisoprenoid-binding protein YceI